MYWYNEITFRKGQIIVEKQGEIDELIHEIIIQGHQFTIDTDEYTNQVFINIIK